MMVIMLTGLLETGCILEHFLALFLFASDGDHAELIEKCC